MNMFTNKYQSTLPILGQQPDDIRTVSVSLQTSNRTTEKITISQPAKKGNVLEFRKGNNTMFTINIADVPTLIALIRCFDCPRPFNNEADRHNRRDICFESSSSTSLIITEPELHYEAYSDRDVIEIKSAADMLYFELPRRSIGIVTTILGGFL